MADDAPTLNMGLVTGYKRLYRIEMLHSPRQSQPQCHKLCLGMYQILSGNGYALSEHQRGPCRAYYVHFWNIFPQHELESFECTKRKQVKLVIEAKGRHIDTRTNLYKHRYMS